MRNSFFWLLAALAMVLSLSLFGCGGSRLNQPLNQRCHLLPLESWGYMGLPANWSDRPCGS